MTQPGIPTDDPDHRHDPSLAGTVALLGCLAFLALIVYAYTLNIVIVGILAVIEVLLFVLVLQR